MNITELKDFITLAEVYIWINLCLMLLTIIGFILHCWFLYREHKPVKPERPTSERLEQRLNWLDTDIAARHNLVNSRTAILQKQIDIIKTNIDKINENLHNLSFRRSDNKATGKRNV